MSNDKIKSIQESIDSSKAAIMRSKEAIEAIKSKLKVASKNDTTNANSNTK